MAAAIRGLFRDSKPSLSEIPISDSDFADFAGVTDRSPSSLPNVPTGTLIVSETIPTIKASVPYTKWYNVHERHSLGDFKQEAVILTFILMIFAIHVFGTSSNRKKAHGWIAAHGPVLHKEFRLLGFGDVPASNNGEEWDSKLTKHILREKSPSEFSTYATGRQNIAFIDISLTLLKRYSPLTLMAEYGLSLFFDSIAAPSEQMQAVIYPFDGKEAFIVPGQVLGANELHRDKSAYDGFVWAVVNKDTMKQLREDRYDLSLTSTKDTIKLPNWATVMTESAEITEYLLTPELIKAVEQSGELLNHLIITDQPVDQPVKLKETVPKKRIYLSIKIPPFGNYKDVLPLFQYFLRLTDTLVQSAHFRPEVLRKVKSTRDEAIRKLQRAEEDEKAEERNIEREKSKKLKRDLELKALDAKGQKKYLEKEKEREMRKGQKRMTQK